MRRYIYTTEHSVSGLLHDAGDLLVPRRMEGRELHRVRAILELQERVLQQAFRVHLQSRILRQRLQRHEECQ